MCVFVFHCVVRLTDDKMADPPWFTRVVLAILLPLQALSTGGSLYYLVTSSLLADWMFGMKTTTYVTCAQ